MQRRRRRRRRQTPRRRLGQRTKYIGISSETSVRRSSGIAKTGQRCQAAGSPPAVWHRCPSSQQDRGESSPIAGKRNQRLREICRDRSTPSSDRPSPPRAGRAGPSNRTELCRLYMERRARCISRPARPDKSLTSTQSRRSPVYPSPAPGPFVAEAPASKESGVDRGPQTSLFMILGSERTALSVRIVVRSHSLATGAL